MTESHRRFGELLKEGIKRVQIMKDKPIGVILDEFGYELRPEEGAKGRYALGHWYYKKRIPADMFDVEKLARLIVLNSDVEREWLMHFLESAGHPNPDKFCNQFFIPAPVEPHPAAETPAAQIMPAASTPEPIEAVPHLPMQGKPALRSRIPLRIIWLMAALAIIGLGLIVFRPMLLPATTEGPLVSPPASSPIIARVPSNTASLTETPHLVPSASPTSALTLTRTVTPASASPVPQHIVFDGRCPAPNSPAPFVYAGPASITAFLNAGGAPTQLIMAFREQAGQNPDLQNAQMISADLTGDGVDEIVVNLLTGSGSLLQVLGCNADAYQPLWQDESAEVVLVQTISHLNANSRADIIRYRVTQGEDASFYEYSILEWNGSQFRELMDPQWFYQVGESLSADIGPWELAIPNASAVITDTNGDSNFELVITGGLESPVLTCETVFQRQFSDTWVWDGTAYQFSDRIYMPPLYRFQSNQDGDLAFALREYDRALESYQKTIFDADLQPRNWFPSYLEHCGRIGAPPAGSTLSPEDENQLLEAYARWRILLIQTILGHPDSMQVVYNTLSQKFPEGTLGHAYVVIATAFWDSYQGSADGSAACAQANHAAEGQTLYPGQDPNLICLWP